MPIFDREAVTDGIYLALCRVFDTLAWLLDREMIADIDRDRFARRQEIEALNADNAALRERLDQLEFERIHRIQSSEGRA